MSFPSYSQVEYFEYNQPNALTLGENELNLLLSKKWLVDDSRMILRGDTLNTKLYSTLQYNQNGTFTYFNSPYSLLGKWEIIKDKYIKHSTEDLDNQGKANFGGIYSVLEISDSTLFLSKMLTSLDDMGITLHFQGIDTVAVPWNWSGNQKEEQTHLVLMHDHYMIAHHNYKRHETEQAIKSFKQAEKHLEWLLIHNPTLNPSILRIGKDLYQRLIVLIKDPDQQVDYMEKLKSLEECEKKYFGP
jgi:hypothetical protein